MFDWSLIDCFLYRKKARLFALSIAHNQLLLQIINAHPENSDTNIEYNNLAQKYVDMITVVHLFASQNQLCTNLNSNIEY